ncbi:hypothetical protein HAX54_031911, partial [Datura stramonium]|nr:hypothetical protein [Datura stramonium]
VSNISPTSLRLGPSKHPLKYRCGFEVSSHFPTPVFHLRFAVHDWKNVDVAPVSCNSAQADSSAVSHGSQLAFRCCVADTVGT